MGTTLLPNKFEELHNLRILSHLIKNCDPVSI